MSRPVSFRAASAAVVTALLVGIIASLAIRPPGSGGKNSRPGVVQSTTESVNWKVASAFGTNLPIIGEAPVYASKALHDATRGAIQLEVYEPSELVPAFSITDSVREQKIAAGFTWVGYDQGKIPASALIGAVPFGMEPWEFLAWWREAGGKALGEELYHALGVQPILCGIISPETAGWFTDPIETLDDLRGLKIRFAGLGGKVLQRLGASVTMMPAGEIFQALEKGAIDASEFSLPVIDRMLGFDRVAKYNYFPGWHQPFTTSHLLVNLQVWESLRADTRALIEMACDSATAFTLGRSEATQGDVLSQLTASGVTTGVLPTPVLRRLEEVTAELLSEEAAGDAMFARILSSQQAFSKSYALWKQLGYLPRDF